MLKSFFSGIGGGLGRFVGKLIGVSLIGYFAYNYLKKNDINIDTKLDNIIDGVFYEKN